VREYHAQVEEGERLHFGIGITVGQAVVGNIGSAVLHNFTAIGDCVNMSARLSDAAAPGQILISAAVYERVRDWVVARSVGSMRVKGHGQPDLVFEVLGLTSDVEESLSD
jgi:class 3 adenylate cyclase